MKKWINPELLSLGVENTFEDCGCDATTFKTGEDNTSHYCHDDGKYHGNGCKKPHYMNNGCKGIIDQCAWYGPDGDVSKSKCCCLTRSSQGQS